jgi:hypothetical protein
MKAARNFETSVLTCDRTHYRNQFVLFAAVPVRISIRSHLAAKSVDLHDLKYFPCLICY